MALNSGVAFDGAAAAGGRGGLEVGLSGGAADRAASPPLTRRDRLLTSLAVLVGTRLLAILGRYVYNITKYLKNTYRIWIIGDFILYEVFKGTVT